MKVLNDECTIPSWIRDTVYPDFAMTNILWLTISNILTAQNRIFTDSELRVDIFSAQKAYFSAEVFRFEDPERYEFQNHGVRTELNNLKIFFISIENKMITL